MESRFHRVGQAEGLVHEAKVFDARESWEDRVSALLYLLVGARWEIPTLPCQPQTKCAGDWGRDFIFPLSWS